MDGYPVRHHLPDLHLDLLEVRKWCWDEYVDCMRVGCFWFFRDESDRMRFLMRWA
jgi:hypothetical protein